VKKVFIDPGHGGYDPGAVGPAKTKEKNVALQIALKTANYLRPHAEVQLSRETDISLGDDNTELTNRCEMANQWRADLFVSIHLNAGGITATGTETYHAPGSKRGAVLAGAIQTRLVSALSLLNRGVKQANFTVLKRTDMPAALVEVAFISNPSEEALMSTAEFQDRAAQAIAAGICDYLGIAWQDPASVDPSVVRIEVAGKILDGKLIDDRTFAPIRALAEALGHTVEWDGERNLVKIV